MKNRLKIRFFQTLLLVCMVFSLASVAQAGSSLKHHHHGKTDIVSPFEKINMEKPLYCILNMHRHFQNTDCPHQKQGEKNDSQATFRPDCPSSSGSGGNSSVSFANDLFKIETYFVLSQSQFSSKIDLLVSFINQNVPRLIDHPPQLA